jgi:hypothetical protein
MFGLPTISVSLFITLTYVLGSFQFEIPTFSNTQLIIATVKYFRMFVVNWY